MFRVNNYKNDIVYNFVNLSGGKYYIPKNTLTKMYKYISDNTNKLSFAENPQYTMYKPLYLDFDLKSSTKYKYTSIVSFILGVVFNFKNKFNIFSVLNRW